jgi:hypothetical protein
LQRIHSNSLSARQDLRQQLLAWLAARRDYEAAYNVWQASQDADSDRQRIRALEAVAEARAAVLEGARQ